MVNVTVKTIDSKIHSFDVPGETTIKEFKGFIASTVNLPPEIQKLILKGSVLQDDKTLNDYELSGKPIHLIKKAEIPGSTPTEGISMASTNSLGQSFNLAARSHGRGDTVEMECEENEETALKNLLIHVPEEWITTIQQDIRRQLGMPGPLPFSDGFIKLLTRSNN